MDENARSFDDAFAKANEKTTQREKDREGKGVAR